MARAIITEEGVFIEDGTDEFILPFGVFAEDQAVAAVAVVQVFRLPALRQPLIRH